MLNKLAIRSILKLQHISPYFLVYLYTAEVDIVNDHVSRPLNCQKKNPLYLISKRQICEGWQILGPSNSNKQQPSRALVHRFLTR